MQNFLHLNARPDPEQRIWIDLAVDTDSTGVLNTATLSELGQCLENFQATQSKGYVLRFIPTQQPDKHSELPAPTLPESYEQNLALIKQTQQIAELLSHLNTPSVFILNQHCPVGGLSLVLAADYCIAPYSAATEHCFPENLSGLHPSPYAVRQLIKRVGTETALHTLMTYQSGVLLAQENFSKNSWVDACVPDHQLHEVIIKFIDKKPNKREAGLKEKIGNTKWLRSLTASKLERQLRKEQQLNPAHYPAPYALLQLWKEFGNRVDEETQAAYAESLSRLMDTEQSAGLQRTARLRFKLQTEPATQAIKLKRLHLINGGDNSSLMTSLGGTSYLIASHCLLQGIKVSIQTHRSEAAEQVTARITEKIAEIIPADSPAQSDALLRNLHFDPQGENIKTADMILLVDSPSVANQQEKFAELEEYSRPDAILATHSSTIPLEKIAAALLKPERLLGIHFCYPASTTPLVEVSYTPATAAELPARAAQLLRSINKLPLLINNKPGLLVNRILMQYILRGIQLHQQGVPQTLIDKAGHSAGMSCGPLELADQIGLDYCLQVAGVLEKAFGVVVPYQLVTMVQTGKLGRKSGSGFYRYRNNRRMKPAKLEWEGSPEALKDKLIRQIVEEAAICLEDGVTEDPDLINAGIIFGTGFAAWTGNPLHYLRNRHANDHLAATPRKHENRCADSHSNNREAS